MPISAVAIRYANALADVVTTSRAEIDPQAALAELRSFETTLKESPALQNALTTPAVAVARKRAVVRRIAEVLKLSRITQNFLLVLVDHRRIASLSDIIQSFEVVIDERLGFARAEVTSARELTEPQRTELNARLESLTGKRIRARYAVDQELIGGLVARIGSTVYDGSVRGQLQTLERRLSAEG